MTTIRLTQGQLMIGSLIANMRHIENTLNHVEPAYGASTGAGAWEINLAGCCGEVAVARYLNLFWCGTLGKYKARDVGGMVDVRATMGTGRRLPLHHRDNDDVPFVLVWARPPDFDLKGWLFAREGKQQHWWCDPSGGGRPAFFVPPDKLRDMPSLRDWVDDRVRSHFLEQQEIRINGQPTQRVNR